MGMSLKECQQKIDAAEFAEFYADYQIEPWGELRGDYQAAIVAQTVAASQGIESTLSDHMIEWGKEPEDEAENELVKKRLLKAFGIEGE